MRNAVKQAFPDAPRLFACVSIFGNLIQDFLLFAELEFQVQLFFVSTDARFHGFAGLPVANPSAQRTRQILSIPA